MQCDLFVATAPADCTAATSACAPPPSVPVTRSCCCCAAAAVQLSWPRCVCSQWARQDSTAGGSLVWTQGVCHVSRCIWRVLVVCAEGSKFEFERLGS